MVRIKKDNIEKTVTKGAFENLYKGLGFEIIDVKKAPVIKEAVFVEKEITPEEDDIVPPMGKEEENELNDFILDSLKNDKPKTGKKGLR